MTRPALHGTDAAAPAGGGPYGPGLHRSPRLRMMLGLARIEALLLMRSVLVLAGLLAGLLAFWAWFWVSARPLWWSADWWIGGGQLFLAMTVLAAAQLAAGRPRRNGMADLYASFPATVGTRTGAQLAGLAGAVPASLLLLCAGIVMVQSHGAIGTPGVLVLAGGVVLVIAAGAAGTAIGTWFPHPLAGLLGALALFLPTATAHLIPGWSIWLIPWELYEDQLGSLPGPLAGYPPAGAHAAELAGVAVLAAIAALVVTVRRGRARSVLAAASVLAVAAIVFAGAAQLAPVPAAGLDHLAAEMADPASVQHCSTTSGVRYCLYPGFGRELPSIQAPVNGVLALLPARPARPLTVQQALSVDFTDPGLTNAHPRQQVSRWNELTRDAPGNVAAASAIYTTLGAWPPGGGSLTDADFNVALAAAEWAVGFTPASENSPSTPYVPGAQAREAIAIWLAILATHPPAGELQQGVQWRWAGPRVGVKVKVIWTWAYPGQAAGGITALGTERRLPAAVYLMAKAMTGLPERKVSQVLADRWATWLNGRTTDAQLAAALGIGVPAVPANPKP
jgi:hypothetical protein